MFHVSLASDPFREAMKPEDCFFVLWIASKSGMSARGSVLAWLSPVEKKSIRGSGLHRHGSGPIIHAVLALSREMKKRVSKSACR